MAVTLSRAVAILVAVLCVAPVSQAARVRDLCEIDGARENMLKGVGIVVGLAGTGDSARAAIQAQERLMRRMNVDVRDLKELNSDNAAVVAVTAVIPPYAKEGTRIDVKVSSMYDAKSLEGGTLLETHLMGPGMDETVYAVAQGGVSVGGFQAGGGGGTGVRKNHVTAGRIPMGAYVEREVPSTITDGQRIRLLLKQPDFSNAAAIQTAINMSSGMQTATALGGGTILVTIPEARQGDLVRFIAEIQEIEVPTEVPSKVIINENTGTIVMGGNVMVKPCQVAHGDLTIRIAVTPNVTPALPFTQAQPVITETADVAAAEQEAFLMPVQGTSAGDVAQALNRLRVTPRDLIAIFQALRKAGALEADLEIM